MVVASDVERRLLLSDLARLQATDESPSISAPTPGAASGVASGAAPAAGVGSSVGAASQLGAVTERLEAIEADTASARAVALLKHLGEHELGSLQA